MPNESSGHTWTDGLPKETTKPLHVSGTEVRKVRANPAQTPTGYESRGPWTWQDITDYITVALGKPISRQRVQAIGEKALLKLQAELQNDPIILEWMEGAGLRVPKD